MTRLDTIDEMLDHPNLEEIQETIKEVFTRKAKGFEGLPVDALLYGGNTTWCRDTSNDSGNWNLRNGFMISLTSCLERKGQNNVWGLYWEIKLLEAVGKGFAKLLNKLARWICSWAIQKRQSGFRLGRNTTDMISDHQLQEKYLEVRIALYQVFFDLAKAFESINKDVLWTILGKIGCSRDFLRMF